MTGRGSYTPLDGPERQPRRWSYGVGDVIEYRSFGGDLRRARVTAREENIKNNRPGFNGELLGPEGAEQLFPEGAWAYDEQIERVIK